MSIEKLNIFISAHFFKNLLSFQTCTQAPNYKAFSSVCVWSYKIELTDHKIYTCVDVVSVLFFVRFASCHWRQCTSWAHDMIYILEWCKTYCIYKNVHTRSINRVMAMLWNNAYNMTCWKMFQHVNKYMKVIWLKPWAVRCGGGCIGLIFNPGSALGMDQISRYPPIFRKFFGFWGTVWGVQKNWVMSVRRGVKSEFSYFVQCTKKIRDIL